MDRRREDETGIAAGSPFAHTVAATPLGAGTPATPHASVAVVVAPDPRYARLEVLGEGGMGEVRLCRDTQAERDVAMKVLRPVHDGSADLEARFLREARVQGRMEHPSIVPVYDLALRGSRPYFTMKRVRGATLAEILGALREGTREAIEQYSRRKLLAEFAKLCLTVDFAHAHGVVHRDLKPDNIMLGPYGELYVLDWGIARIAGDDTAWPGDLGLGPDKTRAGDVFGTLGYMAPEQLDPKLGETDARSDVYALGAILFEILTLEALHPSGRVDKMVASTLADTQPPPSSRRHDATIPPELDDVCVRATSKDPNRRFASARELHAALERVRERDHDADLRRAGAEAHAARAAAAAESARRETDPSAPLRTLCLREASRALAFDPQHEVALATLGELLANPPMAPPPEVGLELAASTKKLAGRRGRIAALLQLSWFAYLPFALVVGLRDALLYAVVSLLFAATAASMYRYSKNPRADGKLPFVTRLLVAASMASLSVAWSPIVLVPSLAVLVAVAWIVVPRQSGWPTHEVLTASGIVGVPVLLAAAGIVPPFFAVDGASVLILPRMIALPGTLTVAVVAATHLLVLLSVAAILSVLRSSLNETQRDLRLQAWQLSQLVAHKPPPDGRLTATEITPRSERGWAIATIASAGSGRGGLDEALVGLASTNDRYEVRGRMTTESDGEFLLCEDKRIGRPVVMKVSPPGDSTLARQARVQARLEHPAIPPVYDVGENDDTSTFVTQRRLHGETLADTLAGPTRPSRQRLLEILCAAARAVDYAHANGVAHGVLSSRCVLVGDYGDVYVTGWSRAVLLEGLGDSDRQAARQADVAALGRVLSEIIAGRSGPDSIRSAGPQSDRVGAPELEATCARAARPPEDGGYDRVATLHDAVERFLEGDRDVERRRVRAAEHVRAAESASELAFMSSGEDSRAEAMGEVIQALALDPSNTRATRVLMRLLTTPPRSLPPDAARDLVRANDEERLGSARTAAVVYACALLVLPVIILQGVVSPLLLAFLMGSIVLASLAFARASRGPMPQGERAITPIVCSMLAACASGAVAGPLVLSPTIVIANMSGFLLQAGTRHRWLVIVLACLAFAMPVALELGGVLPPSYGSRDDALVIVSRLMHFSTSSPLVLASVQIVLVVCVCMFFRRFRDALQGAEQRVLVTMWQLRQLVPAEAKAAMSVPPQP